MQLGIEVVVTLKAGDREFALGIRSDDFPEKHQFKNGLVALCASLEYTTHLVLGGREPTNIDLPFILRKP